MDMKVSVDINLIAQNIGFPKDGVDPTQFFAGKEKDRDLVTRMREKYNLSQNKRGFYIASVNYPVV